MDDWKAIVVLRVDFREHNFIVL